jgi:hypothetical protein
MIRTRTPIGPLLTVVLSAVGAVAMLALGLLLLVP